jgi:hypothetical protein
MTLSHTHEFIFICNGKTGTSSVETALAPYQEGEEFEVGVEGLYTKRHVPPAALKAQLGPDIWKEYFTFAFVRNPWDWFVSQFFWNWSPSPTSKKAWLYRPIRAYQQYRNGRKRRQHLRALERFSSDEIHRTYDHLRQYRGIYEADSLFQYHYAYTPDGERLVDFVGRFENIGEDFARVMQHLGLDEQLPHRNSTSHRDYRSYYTDETAALISDLYAIDIDAFDYSFNGHTA